MLLEPVAAGARVLGVRYMVSAITVRAVASADERRWRELWSGYNAFYEQNVAEEVIAKVQGVAK